MSVHTRMSRAARWSSDPVVQASGPSALPRTDRMARGLGWFSIALGIAELLAPRSIARHLGVEGKEAMICAAGVREIASGVVSLSVDKKCGVWSRVAGDALDITALAAAYRDDNPKKANVAAALAGVIGVTLIDFVCAQGLGATHRRGPGRVRDYRGRSGFPGGIAAARGAAAGFAVPEDMRSEPTSPPLAVPDRMIH
jgi:hypothetical protein